MLRWCLLITHHHFNFRPKQFVLRAYPAVGKRYLVPMKCQIMQSFGSSKALSQTLIVFCFLAFMFFTRTHMHTCLGDYNTHLHIRLVKQIVERLMNFSMVWAIDEDGLWVFLLGARLPEQRVDFVIFRHRKTRCRCLRLWV